MDNDRLLILQYLLHKGDYYRNNAKSAIEKLQRSKYLSTSDLEQIYKAVLFVLDNRTNMFYNYT